MANHTRIFNESAEVVIRVRVTPEQRRSLEVVARDNHLTMTAVIREAVDEFTSDYRENAPVFGICGPRAKP